MAEKQVKKPQPDKPPQTRKLKVNSGKKQQVVGQPAAKKGAK